MCSVVPARPHLHHRHPANGVNVLLLHGAGRACLMQGVQATLELIRGGLVAIGLGLKLGHLQDKVEEGQCSTAVLPHVVQCKVAGAA